MATTFATESSFMSVASDLVTERNVFWKAMLSCVYLAQLASSVTLVSLYGANFQARSLEFSLTIIFMLFGLCVTSIVNSVWYFGKSHVQSKVTVHKDTSAEANTAEWKLMKIVFSLLPLCVLIRYIESTRASGKLLSLEQKLIAEQQSGVTKKPDKLAFSSIRSQKSAAGKLLEGSNLMEEDTQKSIRRQRRYYRRSERSAALIALIHSTLVAGPQVLLQLWFLLRQDIMSSALEFESSELKCLLAVIWISFIWLALTLTQFYPARRVIFDPDGERAIQIRFLGMVCIFLWHFFMIGGRLLVMALFTQCYRYWVILVVGLHWLLSILSYSIYRRTSPGFEPNTPLTTSSALKTFCFDAFFSWVNVYDFVNANQGKTRMRYLMYYFVFYSENIVLLMSWYSSNCVTSTWYKVPSMFIILFSFFIGFLFMQAYYLYLHPEQNQSLWSLIRRMFSMQERRQIYIGGMGVDPLTGFPAGRPYWQERDDVFRAPSHALAPSVYSFSAASHAASIASSNQVSHVIPSGQHQTTVVGSDIANLSQLDELDESDKPSNLPDEMKPKTSTLRNPSEPPKPKPKPRFKKSLENLSNTPPRSQTSSVSSNSQNNLSKKETNF